MTTFSSTTLAIINTTSREVTVTIITTMVQIIRTIETTITSQIEEVLLTIANSTDPTTIMEILTIIAGIESKMGIFQLTAIRNTLTTSNSSRFIITRVVIRGTIVTTCLDNRRWGMGTKISNIIDRIITMHRRVVHMEEMEEEQEQDNTTTETNLAVTSN